MKVVYWLTYVMAVVFLVGETARRGIGYFSVNATTMIEDYLCGRFCCSPHGCGPEITTQRRK
jgi:hypothetical protein